LQSFHLTYKASAMFAQIKNCLQSFISFNNEEEWDALRECLKVKYVRKGQVLLDEGDISDSVIFVNKGLLRIYHTDNDKTFTAKFFVENQFASAYQSFLTKTPSEYALDALEDSEILILKYQDLQDLYKKHPVYERLGRLVAEELFIYVCQRNKSMRQTPEEKYLEFLYTSPNLLQRVPQYIIASFLGITPETLSRLRKKMTRKNLDLNQEKRVPVLS
jgi:CRP/FNR family transcriptional regulator, anaerobic regulatory protein